MRTSFFDALPIWRPDIPNSIDGEPLAVSISDFYLTFPYDRLPESGIMRAMMRPDVPLVLVAAYLASKSTVKKIAKAMDIDAKSPNFIMAVAAHNFALAVFSAIVFFNSWPIVLSHLFRMGWEATYCDQDGSLWREGLGAWATIFYVSKYYEFADTWVLILKGKKPTFLQTYHHTGIVLTLWGGVVSQSAWTLTVVLLNSGIHTVMYTYFLIKTLYPRMEIKAARYLTTAQILQFITGISFSLGVHFMGDKCASSASRFVAACIQIYAVGLIVLFLAFAAQKYQKKKSM